MSNFETEQAEKTGYLMRAIEELSTFVKQHMTQEEARFTAVEVKIEAINKKLTAIVVVGAVILGAVVGKQAVIAVIGFFA